jgi:hypothetical protein
MSFQIICIVLYNKNGDKRTINLSPGKLNIITGASGTGKTALISIIDYCLGSGSCHIPEGVIRDSVEWVGIKLEVVEGEVFIARKIPEPGVNTSSEIYYEVQKKVEIREFNELSKTVEMPTLRKILSMHAGIGENIHEPAEGQSRYELEANIRHSLFFTFQHQNEISSEKHLFHKQSEDQIPTAIKDVLPYFLGAVDEDYVTKKKNLRKLKRELRILKRNLGELDAIQGEGISKAQTLLLEAHDFGIFNTAIPEAWEECVNFLKIVQKNGLRIEEEEKNEEDRIPEKLLDEQIYLRQELIKTKEQLATARSFDTDQNGYTKEADIHVSRLKSIELFKDRIVNNKCPLCKSRIEKEQLSLINNIESSYRLLDNQIREIEERSPQIQKAIRELENRIELIKKELRANRVKLLAIQKSNQRLLSIQDYNAKKAYVMGRIGLYLESLPEVEDTTNLKTEIYLLNEKIKDLKLELSDEKIQDKLKNITSILTSYMNSWAKEFKVEHSENPLRLDLNKLTIVADSINGDIPMDRMGSGENWVGYHLIAFFSLHTFFVKRNRPIPRFLFIDQPSQVYFPADKDVNGNDDEIENEEDRELVKQMYRNALKLVNDLQPNFQIIMTDHANFVGEEWFQECVVQNWRGGKKLVPKSWVNTL